ncbi:MAG: DUF2634 domain-containing protein [Acidaminococcaceae bacterium]|nr:DUF2634 domain-containing protein [Acidaminococcaceae bacterium]
MALLPDTSMTESGSVAVAMKATYPSKTYKMRIEEEQVAGTITDDIEAVEQAVYKILNTERYRYPIYDWNYGIELADLFGRPMPFVLPEVPRRIKEALIQDDRITDVTNFDLSYDKGGSVMAKFTVITIYGSLQAQKEVRIANV